MQCSSGIEISQEVETVLQHRKAHKYAIFKIEDKKRVIIDTVADAVKTTTRVEDKMEFEKLKKYILHTKGPRYILYDFSFELSKDNRSVHKTAFIFW